MKLIILSTASLFLILDKPRVEPMFYEERMIGVIVREGIIQYQEDGKTVYYIPNSILKELPR